MAVTDYSEHQWDDPDVQVRVSVTARKVSASSTRGASETTIGRRSSVTRCSMRASRMPGRLADLQLGVAGRSLLRSQAVGLVLNQGGTSWGWRRHCV